MVLKAEPIVQVEVQDDDDTDDETVAHRAERDRLARIDFSNVKVKQEPLDPGHCFILLHTLILVLVMHKGERTHGLSGVKLSQRHLETQSLNCTITADPDFVRKSSPV